MFSQLNVPGSLLDSGQPRQPPSNLIPTQVCGGDGLIDATSNLGLGVDWQ
jgi:hypothetical protein